jgi:hypothetical protein
LGQLFVAGEPFAIRAAATPNPFVPPELAKLGAEAVQVPVEFVADERTCCRCILSSPPTLRPASRPGKSLDWYFCMPSPRELLDRLDSRHDELIRKLDELNAQIEATLAQFAKTRSDDLAGFEPTTHERLATPALDRRAA